MGRAVGQRNKRFLWRCRACGKQFTVRVGTVFEDSPIPLRHWAYAFWAASASKKGVSSLQIKRMTGLTYKSALFMMHRIRFAMADNHDGQPKLSGIVEADETYVGGKPRYKQAHKGHEKGWLDKKIPVVAIVERGGNIRSFVTADVTAANLANILKTNVTLDSHLMTDSSPVYRSRIFGNPFRETFNDRSSIKANTRCPMALIPTPSKAPSRCSSGESWGRSTTSAASIFIAMSRSSISVGTLAKLTMANVQPSLSRKLKGSGCVTSSQSLKWSCDQGKTKAWAPTRKSSQSTAIGRMR